MRLGCTLRGGPQTVVTRGNYVRQLRQLAALHMLDGRPDLQVDYLPETGRPIVGLDRSHHYSHSSFVDLIATGFAGLVPRDDDVLEIDPLIPEARGATVRWFAIQDARYHGHLVSVLWDADSRYRRGRRLRVFVDGVQVATRDDMGRIAVPLARRAAAPIRREINFATSLERKAFPCASASVNTDPDGLHDAIGGRVMFFPEAPNGW